MRRPRRKVTSMVNHIFLRFDPGLARSALDQPVDRQRTFTLANSGAALDSTMHGGVGHILRAYAGRAYALMTGPNSAHPILPAGFWPQFHDYQTELHGYPIQPAAVTAVDTGDGLPLHELVGELTGNYVKAAVATPSLVRAAADIGFAVAGWHEANIGVVCRYNQKASLHLRLREPGVEQRLRAAGALRVGTHAVASPTIATTETLADVVLTRLAAV